jgi:hypothetical protein
VVQLDEAFPELLVGLIVEQAGVSAADQGCRAHLSCFEITGNTVMILVDAVSYTDGCQQLPRCAANSQSCSTVDAPTNSASLVSIVLNAADVDR